MTDRDPSSPVWSGISIDWGNWKTYLPQLACRCAAKAAENGFTVFGIQFYGRDLQPFGYNSMIGVYSIWVTVLW